MPEYPFPVATHSYFRVRNQVSERERFLNDEKYQPRFTYVIRLDAATLAKQRSYLAPGTRDNDALRLVETAAALEMNASPELVASFRQQNQALFGAPQVSAVAAIVNRIGRRVTDETASCWHDILSLIGTMPESVVEIGPTPDQFTRYRDYFLAYSQGSPLFDTSEQEVCLLLQRCLVATGLDAAGWKLVVMPGHSHAKVNHKAKKITIGRDYSPRTERSAARIAVHEVYGHALRGPQRSLAESEGVAVMLEQLLDTTFTHRRSYRYLAAGLGWGVDGRPRTFREVHEIVWRAMVIMRNYPPDVAKRHAFDECTRVFRGGRPDVAGCVYTKDIVYFAANSAVWDVLAARDMQYNEFKDLLEGRGTVLE